MIYSDFITSTSNYLKSVRILKNYVTFDMTFPSSWLLPKKGPETVEILQNADNDGSLITSFVCENSSRLIDVIENTIQTVIKTNVEREEKERIFKNKVHELKQILEKEKLEPWKVREVWMMGFSNPDHFVDVTDTFDLKVKALHAHASQTSHNPDLEKMVREWGGRNAAAAGFAEGRLAEAFKIINTN